jgi:squalene-hopene/tetraprenyl-beta-curcumene cyclase
MDHGTFCISCHTGLPYAEARSSLHGVLGETGESPVEKTLLKSVSDRVRLWGQVQPYLGDKNNGLATESVINALVLASKDSETGQLTDITKVSLRIMWSTQSKTGSWPWVNFGNQPWEATDSVYWGATLAAMATGVAPEGYRNQPQIQEGLLSLEAYLQHEEPQQSLINRMSLLLAGAKLSGLVSLERKTAILSDLASLQRADGGWSTASLIAPDWKRHDGKSAITVSDGFATGFAALTLEQAGVVARSAEVPRALSWLVRNQDPSTGSWPTLSPNSTKDPNSDTGKFMTDAGTAYAVLALTNSASGKIAARD